jgi:hypothetical protein
MEFKGRGCLVLSLGGSWDAGQPPADGDDLGGDLLAQPSSFDAGV